MGKPPVEASKRQLQLIKIAAEDKDKPVAEALKNTLARNAGRVIDLFLDWDSDGNGMLDKGEFRDALRRMELHVEDKEADEIFDGWDTKGEGELSLPQLQSILKRSSGSVPAAIRKGAQAIEEQRKFEEKRKAEKLAAKMEHAVALKMKQPTLQQEGVLKALAERLEKDPKLFSDWSDAHQDAKGVMTKTMFKRFMRKLNVRRDVCDVCGAYAGGTSQFHDFCVVWRSPCGHARFAPRQHCEASRLATTATLRASPPPAREPHLASTPFGKSLTWRAPHLAGAGGAGGRKRLLRDGRPDGRGLHLHPAA